MRGALRVLKREFAVARVVVGSGRELEREAVEDFGVFGREF